MHSAAAAWASLAGALVGSGCAVLQFAQLGIAATRVAGRSKKIEEIEAKCSVAARGGGLLQNGTEDR
jgi:hypothetical protein